MGLNLPPHSFWEETYVICRLLRIRPLATNVWNTDEHRRSLHSLNIPARCVIQEFDNRIVFWTQISTLCFNLNKKWHFIEHLFVIFPSSPITKTNWINYQIIYETYCNNWVVQASIMYNPWWALPIYEYHKKNMLGAPAIAVWQMIISPVRELGFFLCYKPIHAVEQTVERLEIWNTVTLMFRQCNNNAIKRNFGITVSMILLL